MFAKLQKYYGFYVSSHNLFLQTTMETALYLLPVTLGDTPLTKVLPQYNIEIIKEIRHFIVEDIRSARRFLRQADPQFDIDESVLVNGAAGAATYAIEFLNKFQDKLMYGSDVANTNFIYPLAFYLDSLLHQMKISEEVYAKVVSGNAKKLLGL